MKKLLVIFFSFPFIVFGQTEAIKDRVKDIVTLRIHEWQKKGEFEKNSSYVKRVNKSSRKKMKVVYQEEVCNVIKDKSICLIYLSRPMYLGKYDTENEIFLINITGYKPFSLSVPIAKAPDFKTNFQTADFSINLDYRNNNFVVSYFEMKGFKYDVRHVDGSEKQKTKVIIKGILD